MAPTVEDLQANHAEILAEAEAAYEFAASEERGFTEAEQEADDTRQARVELVERQIANAQKIREMDRTAEAIDDDNAAAAAAAEGMADAASNLVETPKPFASFGEQLMAVHQSAIGGRVVDQRLLDVNAAAQGGQEGVNADGGFLVQTDFSSELLRQVHETGVLSSETTRIPIGADSNGVTMNGIDETSRVDGSRGGGVQAFWTGEAGSKTKSKPTFKQITIRLEKLIGLFYATDELLQDATALEAIATREFADEFGFKVDDAIIRGDGQSKPKGVLTSGALVTVDAEDGQAATTFVAENAENMWSRMSAQNLANARWYFNQDVWPQFFQMKHDIGTGGAPVFLPPGGISGMPFGTLLGLPLQPIEQCSTLGTVGDVLLMDLSEYIMIEKGGIETASSIHVQFTTDETAFRFVLRTNGQTKHDTVLTPAQGTNTTSPFVALATRS